MYKLICQHKFSAAHKLDNYNGQCANLHGHTWKVDIQVTSKSLNSDGMVLDFKDIKKTIDDRFDHKYINDQVNYNPTAENIAQDIYELIVHLIDKQANQDNSTKVEVTVWESEKAGVKYYIE